MAAGERRHVLHPEWVEANGFTWAELRWAPGEELAALRLGPPIPLPWPLAAWNDPPRTGPHILREIATSRLTGSGVEFGAGCNPFPVPLHCTVRYIDRLAADQFEADFHDYRQWQGQVLDKVTPDLVADIEQLDALDEGSLDFMIACHVIEHTRSPLHAFEQAYRKLRPGGHFVLVVPDKRRTFDQGRELTALDHILLDYEHPSRDRDLWHYLEFYTISFPLAAETLYAEIKAVFERCKDIHYHTWTYESFAAMVDYSRRKISPWSEVWSQPALTEHEHGNEFYFVLTK